ncbi:hypothetical protein LQ954_14510 [Sphingomonas sp. IC-11]|uniref:hypothetical protein n=1 Tax=Sphingomonas sp. IC-11 TaxID=2898528 RepID=UPI001E299143|nr:hypothetical protein [Sphingomonas sp. IC-11]MCD2317358.1 hypothetical protein [Sphingomonas sp. IC-11]
MIMIIIAVMYGAAMLGVAWWADARFRGQDRLPMQWLLNGDVTWSAPRRMALAFMPALSIPMLAALIWLFLNVAPRPGQEHLVFPVFVGIGALFVAIQLLHVWLIDRTLRRAGR